MNAWRDASSSGGQGERTWPALRMGRQHSQSSTPGTLILHRHSTSASSAVPLLPCISSSLQKTHMTRITSSALAAPCTSFFVASTSSGTPASMGRDTSACSSSAATPHAAESLPSLGALPAPVEGPEEEVLEEGRGIEESTTKTIAETPRQ